MSDRLQRLLVVPLLGALAGLAADTACRLGAALGVLAFHLGLRRRVARECVFRTLGLRGPRRRAVVRRSYATMGANFLELWTIGRGAGSPEEGVRFFNPHWQALVQRRWPGAVYLTLHLGSWDMGANAVRRGAGRLLVYAKAQHNPLIDALANRQRARAGMEVVLAKHGDRTAAVTVMRGLRDGVSVGLLADQRPSGDEGEPGYFLGVPTYCHRGPVFFARRAKVPLVISFCLRIRSGRSALFVGRPLFIDQRDDHAMTQAGMDLLSAAVAAFPGQYFWQHRRFRDVVALPPRVDEPWRQRGLRLLVDPRGEASPPPATRA